MGEQPKISCVLLAAGASRRMGQPKLTLPFRSSSVLETTLRALEGVGFQEMVVVSRGPLALKGNFRVVEIGEEAERGMHRSIRAGISALGECDGVCVALGDQPLIQTSDYRELISQWDPTRDLIFPNHQGRRGNPSLIGARYFPEILARPDDDRGCHYLFRQFPDRVFAWPSPHEGFYLDLDDWETYRACSN